jgi:16S rRNA (cytosine1402-N4)-methyltransferase
MEDQDLKKERRKRYSGTHPKTFSDKYKEKEPDKYQDTIEKIVKKGNTPAGTHRPICVTEILDLLKIKPGQIGLDATLGYGGHTKEMLNCLNHQGHLYAIDADPIELPKTKERLEKQGYGKEILTISQLNFSDLDVLVAESGKLDFVLADLGVSSMQIDNPERGFSFKVDGPLDLRMDPTKGLSAEMRLREMTEAEIEGMLLENADEVYATEIAKAIVNEYHMGRDIKTTLDLQKVIQKALHFLSKTNRDESIKKACQRTFQAIRIDVNQEIESLYSFLEKLPDALAKGGKVAILSFHSGEDRLVKKSFQYYFRQGVYSEISSEFIRPSMEEQSSNSRAKSAKLRYAIKS